MIKITTSKPTNYFADNTFQSNILQDEGPTKKHTQKINNQSEHKTKIKKKNIEQFVINNWLGPLSLPRK
jgi:hypothetical protein